MSDSFFGIPLAPSPKERTPIPLPGQIQRDLVTSYAELQDAGLIVHPASTRGDKQPLSRPGGSSSVNQDGTRGFGWGAFRDGARPMLTYDEFGLLVRQGRTHGICVLLPRDTKFAMLEIERIARPFLPKIAEAAKNLGVYEVLEALVRGYTEESTRGGLHFPFRVADGGPIQKEKLAEIITSDGEVKLAAEVIGAGFQFVAAPSCGLTHESGLPYTMMCGSPSTIATITVEQQRLIYRAFASINEVQRRAPMARMSLVAIPSDDAVIDFNRRARWEEILLPKGWTKCSHSRDGKASWARPGKRSGISATTLGQVMCNFSSAAETKLPQFNPGGNDEERQKTKLSKFQVYAALWHDNDTQAAATAIRGLGFGFSQSAAATAYEKSEISSLAARTRQLLDHGDVSMEAVRNLIPSAVTAEVLVAAANKERRALGFRPISSEQMPERTDPRLRCGFNQLVSAVVAELHKCGVATLDRKTQTLKRSACHG